MDVEYETIRFEKKIVLRGNEEFSIYYDNNSLRQGLLDLKAPLESICLAAGGIPLTENIDRSHHISGSTYLVGKHFVEHQVDLDKRQVRTEINVVKEPADASSQETADLIQRFKQSYPDVEPITSPSWGRKE